MNCFYFYSVTYKLIAILSTIILIFFTKVLNKVFVSIFAVNKILYYAFDAKQEHSSMLDGKELRY